MNVVTIKSDPQKRGDEGNRAPKYKKKKELEN